MTTGETVDSTVVLNNELNSLRARGDEVHANRLIHVLHAVMGDAVPRPSIDFTDSRFALEYILSGTRTEPIKGE